MNRIHPTAQIGPDVEIGKGNFIGAFAVISGKCSIGNGNWIGPHVVIGMPAQHRSIDHFQEDSEVDKRLIKIGDHNVLREFVTVHLPTQELTEIEDRCFLMTQAHVSHDTIIGSDVTIANSCQIGGHSIVGKGANLGLGVCIHQRLKIGAFSMVGMGSVVTKDLPALALAYGNPARVMGANVVGARLRGLSEESIQWLEHLYSTSNPEHGKTQVPAELSSLFVE